MKRLAAMVWCGSMLVTASAATAATYVPGQVRDGVYIRPHFIAATETIGDRPFTVPGQGDRADVEAEAEPAVLEQPGLPRPVEDASS
jgi:hypothetical protein